MKPRRPQKVFKSGFVGFKKDDVQKLTKLAFETPSLGMLLGLAPNEATEPQVCRIYETSMKAM